LFESIRHALHLLVSGDKEVYAIAWTSLRFAGTSTIICTLISLPLGVWMGFHNSRLKKVLAAILNSLIALPTVVIGLLIYSLLSRSAPLGGLGLLFTPTGIIIGQVVLALPIIASMVYSALSRLDPRLRETLITLGAPRLSMFWMILRESRTAILSAILAGFGRVVGEVGVSMMVGGNIRWYTRTLTTAIALETSKGEFEMGLALGIILMLVAFSINFLLHWTVRHER